MPKHSSGAHVDGWGRSLPVPKRYSIWSMKGWHKLIVDYAPGETHGRHRGKIT